MMKQFFLERTTKLSDLDLSESERQLLSELLEETKLEMPFLVNIEVAYGNKGFPKVQFIVIDQEGAPNEVETYLYPHIGQSEVLEYLSVTHHKKEGGQFLYSGNFVKYKPYITCLRKITFKAKIAGLKTFGKAREIEAYVATLAGAVSRKVNGLRIYREILGVFDVPLNRVIELNLLDCLLIREGEITFLQCEKAAYTLQYTPFYISYETEEAIVRKRPIGDYEITFKREKRENTANRQKLLEEASKRIDWFKKKVEKL